MDQTATKSAAGLPNAHELHRAAAAHAARFNVRACLAGAVVDVAGSLVMATLVGLTAVTALVLRGVPADTIVAELPQSLPLVVFTALAGLTMSLAGGYTAASLSSCHALRHALVAGALAMVFNLALVALLGMSGPLWLTVLAMAGIVPCAALGGWLAMPAAGE